MLQSILRRGLSYFGIVFAAGFLLGSLRTLALVPWVGERRAELLEMPLMIVVVLWAARRITRGWDVVGRLAPLAVGGLALSLLLTAELLGAALLRGQTPAQFISDRDPIAGSAFALSLVLFTLAPAWFARRRGGSPP